jgi:sugar phosphate permease
MHSGVIADRMNLRYFLTIGMLGSATATMLLGVPYYGNIHFYGYFIGVQIFGGLMQSTGWPTVVSIMTHWFGKERRGLLMGIWNAHTSVGNIVGTILPAFWADPTLSHPNPPWGLSFIVPSLIMAWAAMMVFTLLVVDPPHVGLSRPVHNLDSKKKETDSKDKEKEEVNSEVTGHKTGINDAPPPPPSPGPPAQPKAVGFFRALMIPGVIEFSLALFFNKLVSYTFLFWLPYYVKESHPDLSSEKSDWLSTLFDVGGIAGEI